MSMPIKQLSAATPANEATLSKATLSPTSTPLTHRLVFGALSGMGGEFSASLVNFVSHRIVSSFACSLLLLVSFSCDVLPSP